MITLTFWAFVSSIAEFSCPYVLQFLLYQNDTFFNHDLKHQTGGGFSSEAFHCQS